MEQLEYVVRIIVNKRALNDLKEVIALSFNDTWRLRLLIFALLAFHVK